MRPDADPEDESASVSFPFDLDDAIVNARAALDDGLLGHLQSRLRAFGEAGCLAADIADGLLISVLKLITPGGKYPMERGRFWQILDRHDPFSPATPEDTARVRVAREIKSLFAAAENESFEDGFDSAFSLELQRLVLRDGNAAVEIISDILSANQAAPDMAAEALRCLGEMENPGTHEARRQLLQQNLASPSHVARDGAVVALSHLSDPRAIPDLEAAVTRETYGLLRANMAALLDQLKGLQP
jgi:hypothetical protein